MTAEAPQPDPNPHAGSGVEESLPRLNRPRSVGLDMLRIVAILGVVAIHSFGGIVSNASIMRSQAWWIAEIVEAGNAWVIPVFVMVSGALLLEPTAHSGSAADFYRRRLLRLGPAFVFWQFFYVFVVRIGLSHQVLGIGAIAQLFADGTTYTHLYFLWLIAGLYLVAPVLAAFLRGGGERRAMIFAGAVLITTLAVYVLANLSALHGQPQPIVLNALTQWVPYVGYFLAGWALRTVILGGRGIAICAVVIVLSLAVTAIEHAYSARLPLLNALAPPGYLGVIVAIAAMAIFVIGQSLFAGVDSTGRFGRAIARLSVASFGVFLVHFFFIVLVEKLAPAVAKQLPVDPVTALGVWAVAVIVSFAVSLLALRIPLLRRTF